MPVKSRKAEFSDLPDIARIYNQGIQDRIATFEADQKSPEDLEPWIRSRYPVVVATNEGKLVAFAASFPYSSRECYRGVGEFSVYVERSNRGKGTGKTIMKSLIDAVGEAGMWKLVSRVFVENIASRSMLRKIGFREVGIYEKHAQLDGVWKDVVIVEYLIGINMH